MTSKSHTSTRYCCFLVGGDCFAVASASVAEVIRDSRITRVPQAPDAVLGLLHLRGRIVPVIDMRHRLGFPAAPPEASRPHLVLLLNDDWYSLLVDDMLDVIEVSADCIEHPSAPAIDSPHDAVTGIFAGADALVHFLDPERIVNGLGRQREQVLLRQGASHGGS